MKLAIIPARGGSKRIPRKNIKSFCGKPMIAWSIEAALGSECFDQVIVSTDDQEIADVAKGLGAYVPFTRPDALADDYAATGAVIAHAIEWLIEQGKVPTYTCCLYPTAPFVSSDDIRKGYSLLRETGADFAMSVTNFPFPVQRAVWIEEGETRVRMFHPEHFYTRSQDLKEAFHDAGQFYWGSTKAWLEEKPIFLSETVPVVLPRSRVQDIDTPEDWINAELMFKALQLLDREKVL
ncbi:pseudaminic acid cytidylyltransferase [Thalassospira lucentensis]|uniref:pseudaminic acid cytidylyltransferase n=1 Tax=Thalassospira lucentensis TaxID=168935 RepID=UPI00399D747F